MTSIWTDALKERVKELWATHTASQIAAELAKQSVWVTRNAVIGIVNRGKFKLPEGELERRSVRANKMRVEGRPILRAAKPYKPRLVYVKRLVCEEVTPLRISLIDLEEHHCRFPYDGEEATTYCGHSKVEGFSWCEFHKLKCCIPPTNRGVYVARRAA